MTPLSPAAGVNPVSYEERIRSSSVWKELTAVRNIRPSFHTRLGLYGGLAYTGLFYVLGRGKEPWTLKHPGQCQTCGGGDDTRCSYEVYVRLVGGWGVRLRVLGVVRWTYSGLRLVICMLSRSRFFFTGVIVCSVV